MSAKIVVAGVSSLYTSVGVAAFPLRYESTCEPDWADVGVSGVGAHIAQVQRTLGNDVRLCSPVGRDAAGMLIRRELGRLGLVGPGIVDSTASSLGVVLVDRQGRRMGLPYPDPADPVAYPFEVLREQAHKADLLVLTNARFVRPLVSEAAHLGVPIAVDVHRIAGFGDAYDQPWLERADIVFCSNERLDDPRRWVAGILTRHRQCLIAGVGMGAQGAMLGLKDGRLITVDAVTPSAPINTSGAGDALFATFLDVLLGTADPMVALQSGVVHAGWKITHRRPAAVSLTRARLADLRRSAAPRTVVSRWSP